MKLTKIVIAVVVSIFMMSSTLSAQSKYGKTPKDSIECVKNLSLYKEDYQQKRYKEALTPWRWCFLNCPESSANLYIRGANIIKFMIKTSKDSLVKEAYIDTLMMVYDNRITYFGSAKHSREGLVLGKKANDLKQFRPNALEVYYPMYKKSFDMEKKNTQASVLAFYFESLVDMVRGGKEDSAKIFEAYIAVTEVVDFRVKRGGKSKKYYEPAGERINNLFLPFATCEALEEVFGPKLKETPKDTALLKQITSLFASAKCTNSDVFFQAATNLYEVDPSSESAFVLGQMNFDRKDYNNAVKYFEQSVNGVTDTADLFERYMSLAHSYQNAKKYSNARTAAKKAAEVKPNDGSPFILIGDLYAASAASCGDNEVTSKAAYWAAFDKYAKAKSVATDPKIKEEAQKRMNIYAGYFPKSEDIFFRGMKEGAAYTVGCWINESTTVRAKK